jgi:hypothetical protein
MSAQSREKFAVCDVHGRGLEAKVAEFAICWPKRNGNLEVMQGGWMVLSFPLAFASFPLTLQAVCRTIAGLPELT